MICEICGVEFEPLHPRNVCGEICHKVRKARLAKKRNKSSIQAGDARACDGCGKQYVASGARQKYCSTACQQKTARAVYLAKKKTIRRKCLVCGKGFLTGTNKSVTCGGVCAANYRQGLARARANAAKGCLSNESFRIPCPWAGHYQGDVYWPPIRSGNTEFPLMDCPENDPMSWHVTAVCIDTAEQQAGRKAA